MKFEQIWARAESECKYLTDGDYIKIYVGSAAENAAAAIVLSSLQTGIDKGGLKAKASATGSFGYYDLEPTVLIEKPGQSTILYNNVTPEMAAQLVDDPMNQNPRSDLAFCSIGNNRINGVTHISDLPLFNLQERIALRNCGTIDPENINHYILRGQGYSGLSKVLQMGQLAVIEQVKKSGLRGRGGAGYFTADKWKSFHDAEGSEKYMVCNAVDADPRALTARLLLESDPHSVLEGILIGAYAVGASHCIVCVHAECGPSNKRLRKALDQMREYGLLGHSILDSTFSAEIEIKNMLRIFNHFDLEVFIFVKAE